MKKGRELQQLESQLRGHSSVLFPTADAWLTRGLDECCIESRHARDTPDLPLVVLPLSFYKLLLDPLQKFARIPGYRSELDARWRSNSERLLRFFSEAEINLGKKTKHSVPSVTPTVFNLYFWNDAADRPEQAAQLFYETYRSSALPLDQLVIHPCLPEMRGALQHIYGIDSRALRDRVHYSGVHPELDHRNAIWTISHQEEIDALLTSAVKKNVHPPYFRNSPHPKGEFPEEQPLEQRDVLSAEFVYSTLREHNPEFHVQFNQFLVFEYDGRTEVYRCVDARKWIDPNASEEKVFVGLDLSSVGKELSYFWPRTGDLQLHLRQKIALEVLLDPTIRFVFLEGESGSGKTSLAFGSALHQYLRSAPHWTNVIAPEQVVLLGMSGVDHYRRVYQDYAWTAPFDELFQPASARPQSGEHMGIEKPGQYQPIFRHTRSSPFAILSDADLRNVEGQPFNDRYTIIDEAQHAYPGELERIFERVGERGKVVILSNPKPREWRPGLDRSWNGAVTAMARYRKYRSAAALSLTQSFYGVDPT